MQHVPHFWGPRVQDHGDHGSAVSLAYFPRTKAPDPELSHQPSVVGPCWLGHLSHLPKGQIHNYTVPPQINFPVAADWLVPASLKEGLSGASGGPSRWEPRWPGGQWAHESLRLAVFPQSGDGVCGWQLGSHSRWWASPPLRFPDSPGRFSFGSLRSRTSHRSQSPRSSCQRGQPWSAARHPRFAFPPRETEGLFHAGEPTGLGGCRRALATETGLTRAGREPCHYSWHLLVHTEPRALQDKAERFLSAQRSADKRIINGQKAAEQHVKARVPEAGGRRLGHCGEVLGRVPSFAYICIDCQTVG